MNILHYLPRIRLEEGGVVRAVIDMAGLLAAHGHGVTVLTFDDADAPEQWKRAEDSAPRLRTIPAPSMPLGLYSRAQLREMRAEVEKCDALHLHTPWERANAQLASLARSAGKPYVLSIHGMLDDWSMSQKSLKKRLYLAIAGRRLLERAAVVHCTAEAEREQSRKWYPAGRALVVPLVFDLSDFRDLPGPGPARRAFPACDSDGPVVLFLSRVHYKKGIEVLIDAAGLLAERGGRFAVVIAGTGEAEYVDSLRARARERAVEDRVHFVGMVTGVEKVSLYQRADVFVLPTSQENFGFVLPEALACRTPAITTKGVDIWPELERSGGAVIVDRTAEATADAIERLLADPDRRREMGEAGRRWVFEHLEPQRVVEAFERMYRRAADARD